MNLLSKHQLWLWVGVGTGLAVVCGLWLVLMLSSLPEERELSNFSTSLKGRTRGQRHNARLAARALNGVVVGPGEVFSFNKTVGPWTRDRGYKKAPVSYGGEMVITWGGGVCQVSSTLYNAALLAGMKIVEREHHVWQTKYLPPGRDAAVAYGTADLRFQNPYREPVRIVAEVKGETLTCRLLSKAKPKATFKVIEQVEALVEPTRVVQPDPLLPRGQRLIMVRGKTGYHVRVYRLRFEKGKEGARELISDDFYKPLPGVVRIGGGR